MHRGNDEGMRRGGGGEGGSIHSQVSFSRLMGNNWEMEGGKRERE